MNLSHPKNNVLIRHLRHAHATPQALEAARNFGSPACEAAKHLCAARQSSPCEVQPLLKSIAMDVKELLLWIPGETGKTLHVVCEGSSMHAAISFGDDDTETSQTLQRLLSDAWLRPYIRPRWLKVDPHRAQISDEFMNWCEQRGIEVVDSAGSAKEQQGKVEHHTQLFELMLEDVLADVQPQTEYEWRECLTSLQEAKSSLLSVSGVSPIRSQSRDLQRLPVRQP